MDNKSSLNSNSVFRRTLLIAILLGGVAFVLLIGALFNVQIINSEKYQSKAVAQQTRNEIINPSRGTIYDRNMNVLAVSTATETVCISPHDISDEERQLIVTGLVSILGVDYDTLYEKTLKTDSYYAYVKKQVSSDVADKVREFITQNGLSQEIFFVEDTSRTYPYATIGSQTVGFVGSDGQGLLGIEYSYDDTLTGTPGRIVAAKNAKGTDMPSDYEVYYDAEDGQSIVLTLDAVVQGYLDNALKEARENAGAESATGIVMDVNNAQILAMGTYPNFDSNDPFTISDETLLAMIASWEESVISEEEQITEDENETTGETEETEETASETTEDALTEEEFKEKKSALLTSTWTNSVVTTTYEPGSVFKIITAAMALEEHVTTLYDDSFYCEGTQSITIYDRTIGCWSDKPHGQEDFVHGIMNSCNPVFIEVGKRLGGNTFFKYFEAFGFTQKTGIELPGEAGGSSVLYHDAEYLSSVPISLATSTFGQTFNVTPIQLITAVSAAVNGGTLYKPMIVKQVINADGIVSESYESHKVRQVLTEETSEDLCYALEKVVSEGTGSNAYVKGYSVGGKTGTTVITSTNETDNKEYISSFLAFAPSDNPEIAVLILCTRPTSESHSGNMLSAPYAAQVIEKTLKYLGVEPHYTADEYATLDVTIPDFTGMTLAELEEYCDKYDLTYRIEGDGTYVTDQMPVPNAVIPRNNELVIYMGGSKPSGTVGIPDFTNMTLEGIKKFMKNSNIYIRTEGYNQSGGYQYCVSQSPEPGTYVEPGSVLTINFVNDTSDQNIE